MKKQSFLLLLISVFTISVMAQEKAKPEDTEVWSPIPKVVPPAKSLGEAPSDAIVLFNGKDLSQWQHVNGKAVSWKKKDEYLQCNPGSGNIQTKKGFGDCVDILLFAEGVEVDPEDDDADPLWVAVCYGKVVCINKLFNCKKCRKRMHSCLRVISLRGKRKKFERYS